MNERVRELLRLGRCGPASRVLGYRAARLRLPGAELLAFGLLGKPRRGPVEVEVEREGLRWDLDLRDDAHRLMFLDLYERELRARTLDLLPPGGRFVDVGANVGFWAIPASRRLGPKGCVVAFEPNPWAAARLERNLELNADPDGMAPVELVQKAVGEGEASANLVSDHLAAGASHATLHPEPEAGRGESVVVLVVPLDGIVTDLIDVLKIDVEGHEAAVLRGASGLLDRSPPRHIVIELQGALLQRAGSSAEEIVVELERRGYEAIDGDGVLGRGAVTRPLAPDFFETVVFAYRPAASSR